VFATTCRNSFINYDDDTYVVHNPQVLGGVSIGGLEWAVSTTTAANWHPLTWLSLQLDAGLYDTDPRGYHLTSVLVHAASTAVLFLALLRLTGCLLPSALASALFAWHPLRVESVAWAAERKDVLSGLFFMLCLYAYARYAARPGAGHYVGLLAAFALGLLAKPMLVTLPCVLLLVDSWPLCRWSGRRGVSGLIVEKIPLAVLALASCVVTLVAQARAGAMVGAADLPSKERVTNALEGYVGYLQRTLWPFDLAAFYPMSGTSTGQASMAWSAIGFVGLCVAALIVWRRAPYVPVGWLWFFGMLVPVVGVVQVGLQGSADRYTYLPSIGLALIVAWGLRDLVTMSGLPAGVAAIPGAALLVACVALTSVQIAYWRDSVNLWQHALDVTRGNYLAHYNLALALDEQGHIDLAMRHYVDAVQIHPGYEPAHYHLGLVLRRRGDLLAAIRQWRMALSIDPDDATAHNELGLALASSGKLREARDHFATTVRLRPDSAEAQVNLGLALLLAGKTTQAEAYLSRAVALQPERANNCYALGRDLRQLGKADEAEGWLRRAIERDPRQASYYYELGCLLHEQGRRQSAAEYLAIGRRLDPRWPEMTRGMAWTFAAHPERGLRSGRTALWLAQDALTAADPPSAAFYDTLAAAYAEAGRYGEAEEAANKALALVPRDNLALRQSIAEHLTRYRSRQALNGDAGQPRAP
jgi:tetratricopeptide (TPR) repeat protein